MKEYFIPTLNLTMKSIPRIAPKLGNTTAIKKQESASLTSVPQSQKKQYKHFLEFSKEILKLKLHKTWKIVTNDEDVHIMFTDSEYCTQKHKTFVDISLGYSIRVFSWFLNDDHQLYKRHRRSFFNITLTELLCNLQQMSLCKDINVADSKQSVYSKRHVILKSFNYQNYLLKDTCERTCTGEYIRNSDCDLLIEAIQQSCSFCKKRSRQLKSEKKKKLKHDAEPAKLKAPISVTSPDRLILTLKQH